MVRIQITPEAGNKLDVSGGPIPALNLIIDKFKPEVIYATPTSREFWMVMELNDASTMGEMMLISSMKFGSYPEFTPILSVQELYKIVGPAIATAIKASSEAALKT
jgi:hypothetical protein